MSNEVFNRIGELLGLINKIPKTMDKCRYCGYPITHKNSINIHNDKRNKCRKKFLSMSPKRQGRIVRKFKQDKSKCHVCRNPVFPKAGNPDGVVCPNPKCKKIYLFKI